MTSALPCPRLAATSSKRFEWLTYRDRISLRSAASTVHRLSAPPVPRFRSFAPRTRVTGLRYSSPLVGRRLFDRTHDARIEHRCDLFRLDPAGLDVLRPVARNDVSL